MAKAASKKKANTPSLVDKAAKLTKVAKIIVFAISGVMAGLVFYLMFFMPYTEEKAGLESSISSNSAAIRTKQSELKKHQNVGQYKAEIENAYKYMQKFLPQENEMPRLVQMVSEIGARAGLSDGVTLFAPKLPAVVQKDYAEIPFTMNLEGEFLTILSFLYNFSRMDRIVNITQVEIGTPKMVDEKREILHISVKCAGSTYRALTQAEVEQAIAAAAAPKGKR